MFRGHSRAVRLPESETKVTKAPLKGLFSNGAWKCNCNPRLPAQHFQVKNGGKNHGRWFYVCQLPQTKRCDLFLWDDEAKTREAACVLNNSRAEPGREPVTPPKALPQHGLPTPQTERHIKVASADAVETPYTPSKPPRPGSIGATARVLNENLQGTNGLSGDDEFYDWPESGGERVDQILTRATHDASYVYPHVHPETPRKSVKTDPASSPRKRGHDDNAPPVGNRHPTPSSHRTRAEDIFSTPATSKKDNLFQDASEAASGVRYPDRTTQHDSDLANEILASLQSALSVPLFAEAQEEIKAVCYKHTMHVKGITKGRDISRDMVKRKEARIVDLQGELEALRREKEMDGATIRHLRQELAAQRRTSFQPE